MCIIRDKDSIMSVRSFFCCFLQTTKTCKENYDAVAEFASKSVGCGGLKLRVTRYQCCHLWYSWPSKEDARGSVLMSTSNGGSFWLDCIIYEHKQQNQPLLILMDCMCFYQASGGVLFSHCTVGWWSFLERFRWYIGMGHPEGTEHSKRWSHPLFTCLTSSYTIILMYFGECQYSTAN